MSFNLRAAARRVPGLVRANDWLARKYNGFGYNDPSRRGNYNSPVPDLAEVRRRAGELFRKDIDAVPGVDIRADQQLALLRELAGFAGESRWPAAKSDGGRYYTDGNEWFPVGDATVLEVLFRHLRPKRVIEIGSGFSSAAMLDVCDRHLPGATRLTFIEPRPDRLRMLLREGDAARVEVIESDVQSVPATRLTDLGVGDVLFIDSSHAVRIGGDVNYLLFEVLPRLPTGCVVHIHDIFWPFEYPPEWVLGGLAWNEAYLVRAFLMYNPGFEVLLFNDYLTARHPDTVRIHVPQLLARQSGSLWLRKTAAGGA